MVSTRALVWSALVPISLFAAYSVAFSFVLVDEIGGLIAVEAVLFIWTPLLLHVPLLIGAGLYLRKGTGGRWLRNAWWPLVPFVAVFMAVPAAVLFALPFHVATLLAWFAGKRLGNVANSPLPDLPQE